MVNTFMPHPDFEQIAQVLDNKRLGKQRVEAMQILNVLEDPTRKAWRNHPAAVQWRGYTEHLKLYINTMIDEWIKRGFKNSMKKYEVANAAALLARLPWFVTCKAVNLSHQASLIRKLPEHYGKFFFDVPEEFSKYSYIWTGALTEEQVAALKAGDLTIAKYAKPL